MGGRMLKRTFGWCPEPPDHRDFIIDEHPDTASWFVQTDALGNAVPPSAPPPALDLSEYCSPVEDQGQLGSCVAQAVCGVVEFLERRNLKSHVEASRLFVYKTGRQLLGWTGDTGLYVRTGMQALAVFGVAPERYWPYDVLRFDEEPPAFCYGYAQRFRALRYYRLDRVGRTRENLLRVIKCVLLYRIPVVFGFVVYSYGDRGGCFPMPTKEQAPLGGHAVVAVGWDDARTIGSSVGALKIRNSWGTQWGDAGYGWLPYDYVLQGLSNDFWALYCQSYVRTP